jgi:TonB family protein
MLTRTEKVNMLAAIALAVCLSAANANASDEPNLGPCREQNYSLLVQTEPIPGRKPVKILDMPRAEYPEAAYKNKIFGKLTLTVRFLAGGKIGNIDVVKGLPGGLTEEAVRAARRIRFIPAREDGRLTNTAELVDYYFVNPSTCTLE